MKTKIGLTPSMDSLLAMFEKPKEEGANWTRVIMAKIHNEMHPYVCAHQFAHNLDENGEQNWNTEWAWGHYFEKYEDALEKFIELVRR
jgi:hypothetical protein